MFMTSITETLETEDIVDRLASAASRTEAYREVLSRASRMIGDLLEDAELIRETGPVWASFIKPWKPLVEQLRAGPQEYWWRDLIPLMNEAADAIEALQAQVDAAVLAWT